MSASSGRNRSKIIKLRLGTKLCEKAESIQNPKLVNRDYVFLLELNGKINYDFGAFLLWLSCLSMQNTRLNNLVNVVLAQLGQWFANPWRRFSLVLISLLLGLFLGSAIPTTADNQPTGM